MILRIPKCFENLGSQKLPRSLLQAPSEKTTLFANAFDPSQRSNTDALPVIKSKRNHNTKQQQKQQAIGAPAASFTSDIASTTKLQQAPPLRQILGTGLRHSVVLVAGPQHSGKSTLCRSLANALFSQHGVCFWLDLDLGRPEFLVSGTFSVSMLVRPINQRCTKCNPYVWRTGGKQIAVSRSCARRIPL